MARKHYSEMTPERKKELRKQYRNPPTREYQQMRVLRVALLCLALLCAFAASPISFVPEAYRFAFVVIGNLLVLAAILLDVFKMRSMREEYIDENLNNLLYRQLTNLSNNDVEIFLEKLTPVICGYAER